jgi:hypothetical protein
MTKLLWELKTLVCDICKKNEMKKTIKIKGEWKGVCSECEPNKEVKNEQDQN